MDTKLTLSIEENIIKKAKDYARSKGKTLSDLVESYLKTISIEETESELTPITKSLKGSFHVPEDFDYKSALADRQP